MIGSYVSTGHDGKLFVTTMLPLTLAGLTIGIRDLRHEGYAIVALAVGLMMLSPHPQMPQNALLAAGLFTWSLRSAPPDATSDTWLLPVPTAGCAIQFTWRFAMLIATG